MPLLYAGLDVSDKKYNICIVDQARSCGPLYLRPSRQGRIVDPTQ